MVKTVTLQQCSTICSGAEPEILHDDSLSGKDQVNGQNSDPAALQYYMQCCRKRSCDQVNQASSQLNVNEFVLTKLDTECGLAQPQLV